MRRRLLAVCLLLAAAGCAPFTLVMPERQDIAGVISVEPGLKWNRVALSGYRGNVEVWTLDGPTLNTLVFFTGVPDGEPLFTRAQPGGQSAQQEKPPVFRSKMNPVEIQELLEATMASFFQTTIAEARTLKPATIADGQGFRFETRLVGKDEVEREGAFVGTIRSGRLYGAWFQGARLHYFRRYLPEFERMVTSARLTGAAAR